MTAVLHLFVAGGLWNVPVAVVAALLLTFIGERTYVLVWRLNGDARTLMTQLQRMILAGNLEEALSLCQAEPHTALARVARSALARMPKGEIEVVRAVEEAQLEVQMHLHRRDGVLLGLALLSVCAGGMGTVFGLAMTLRRSVDGDVRDGLLPLDAMADDLGCAALGFVVAAVALCAHLLLAAVRNKVSAELDLYSVKLRNLLLASRGGAGGLADPAKP